LRDNSKIRTAFYYKNYFFDFYNLQRLRVRNKILKTIKLIEDLRIVPDKFLKHITGTIGLYEIRVKVGSDIFRVFCFFDSDNLIILINGFQKKTQKTPDSEIRKALQLKSEYENEK
jgi:phage-related protein